MRVVKPGLVGVVTALLLSSCGEVKSKNSCSAAMFDKYGLAAMLAVNDRVIERAVAAPTARIGTTFQTLAASPPSRVEAFRAGLGNFLVFLYGGPNLYTGRSMEKAHLGLNVSSPQYDYFVLDVIVPALADVGVSQTDIVDCFVPVLVNPELKASIINR